MKYSFTLDLGFFLDLGYLWSLQGLVWVHLGTTNMYKVVYAVFCIVIVQCSKVVNKCFKCFKKIFYFVFTLKPQWSRDQVGKGARRQYNSVRLHWWERTHSYWPKTLAVCTESNYNSRLDTTQWYATHVQQSHWTTLYSIFLNKKTIKSNKLDESIKLYVQHMCGC